MIELLGVRFRPPHNCVMRVEGEDANTNWIISERSPSPRFMMRFSRLVTSQEGASPQQQIDQYVANMTQDAQEQGGSAAFSVRERRMFQLAGVSAGLIYAQIRDTEGTSAVRGYLLLQLSPEQFIVLTIQLPTEEYATMAPLLDKSLKTLELVTREEASAARRARLQRGEAFLRTLDEDSLRTALDPPPPQGQKSEPRWYRIARKTSEGAEHEVGYLTVSVVEAPQGAANPSRDSRESHEGEWNDAEKEMGLLVRVMMRTLLDERGTAITDTEARYWVRWDRQREFWTSRSTRREGKKSQSSTQLGVRDAPTAGALHPALEVSNARQGVESNVPRRFQLPEAAYVSLAEAMVLPRLLAREAGPGDYGFNWFNPNADRPCQRRDLLQRTSQGFMLESQGSVEVPAVREKLGPRGEMLLLESDDGSFTEVTEPAKLQALWRQKGLPTG